MNKKIMILSAALCIGTLSAAEIFKVAAPADFEKTKKITQESELLLVNGSGDFFTAKDFKLDPAKKYKLSGQFRLRSGSPVQVWLGYAPLNSKKKVLFPIYVNPVANTGTEVVAAARRGTKLMKVKDASKWKQRSCYVAFNVKDDFSDLPNFSVLAIAKDGVKQNGDVWEITLAQPLKKNIAEGTKVREHINGATFIWNAGTAKVQNKWINRAGVLNGQVMPGKPVVGHKLWPGTQSVRIIIRVTGKADSVTELRNIKIEEL